MTEAPGPNTSGTDTSGTIAEWRERIHTGIAAIDADHERLLVLLDEIGRERAAIAPVLAQLLAYAAEHFRREEDLFRAMHWSQTIRHVRQHREFERTVTRLQTALGDRPATIQASESFRKDIEALLRRWLVDHIYREDLQYAAPMAASPEAQAMLRRWAAE